VVQLSKVFIFNSIIYANTVVMLAIGLTLTYLTTKVPNFAHGSIAVVGAYLFFTVAGVYMGEQLYQGQLAAPVAAGLLAAFLGGAVVGLLEYLLALRPLKRRGATLLGLMIATLGVDLFMIGMLNIYADIVGELIKQVRAQGLRVAYISSRDWNLRSYFADQVAGAPLSLWLSTGVVVASLVALYLLLTRTRFGVAMRAAIENPNLAGVLGVNVDLVNMASWFIAGGLAGLAGALMGITERMNPATGSLEVVVVFAASIVGGLESLAGAVAGGYLVGLSETLGTRYIGALLGINLYVYRKAVPLLLIIVTLLLAPRGLAGLAEEKKLATRLQALFSRMRRGR